MGCSFSASVDSGERRRVNPWRMAVNQLLTGLGDLSDIVDEVVIVEERKGAGVHLDDTRPWTLY